MNEIAEEKKQLRKQLSKARATLDIEYKSKYDEWVCAKIWEIVEERHLKTVHCYLPIGTEINITSLIEKLLEAGITVVSPKTLPYRELQNLVLSSMDDVKKGVFGTTYPAHSEEFIGEYDLIIVPGLAFDSSNYRLGYGGGYYDTFLTKNPKAYKLGVFYPFQEINKVPLEMHDVRLDNILVNNTL